MDFGMPILLLLLIPALFLLYYKDRIPGVAYSPLSWALEEKKINISQSIVKISEWFFLITLILALAEPYYIRNKTDIEVNGFDMVVAIDISASMQAADFLPNRLESMKEMLIEFVNKTKGGNISLVVFSGKPFLHSPFTQEKRITIRAIDTLHFQTISHSLVGGTNIGDAILFSVLQFEHVKNLEREKVLLVLTDGENSGGIDPILSAKDALSKNIHLYIVGIAGEKPVPVFYRNEPYIAGDGKQLITSLDDEGLKKVASAGGGIYFRAEKETGLGGILNKIYELEKKPIIVKDIKERKSLSNYLILICTISFCINFYYAGRFVRRPLR